MVFVSQKQLLSVGLGNIGSLIHAAAPAGGSFYYHTDHQGSVRAVTDDLGNVVNEYSYSAYGEAETAVETLPQPFRFTAREYDPDTDLMHYRARAYDPATGRFLQEDPLGFEAMHPKRGQIWDGEFPTDRFEIGFALAYASELNPYRYVGNNPLKFVDPTGTVGLGPLYESAKKRALIAVNGTKRVGGALNDKILKIYVKLETRAGGRRGLENAGGCAEQFIRGWKGSGGAPTVFKPNEFYKAGCYFAGQVAKGVGSLFGGTG